MPSIGELSGTARKALLSEVRAGFECGARIDGCDAYQPGDVIEAFEILQIKPTL